MNSATTSIDRVGLIAQRTERLTMLRDLAISTSDLANQTAGRIMGHEPESGVEGGVGKGENTDLYNMDCVLDGLEQNLRQALHSVNRLAEI